MGTVAGPSADALERGLKIVSVIDWSSDAPGTLFDATGTVLWRFHTNPRRAAWSIHNIRRKPEFVVCDASDRELVNVRRTARLPPTFQMEEAGRIVGHIRLRSIFRNVYVIDLRNGATWRFWMPLYSSLFRGQSSTGSQVWVSPGDGGKRHWNILLSGEEDRLHVLSALAFIHREWWCYA